MTPLKWRNLTVLLALAAVLLLPMAAMADMLTFNISVGNKALVDGGFSPPYASVQINETDTTHATITVTAFSPYLLGDGGAFAFNTASGVTATASGFDWTGGNGETVFTDEGLGNVSDFGFFTNVIKNKDGFNAAVSQLVFYLTATSGSWADAAHVFAANTKGWFAASHIFPPNGSDTGFAAGKPTTMPIPLPPTVFLLGSGLLGLGVMGWRKKK